MGSAKSMSGAFIERDTRGVRSTSDDCESQGEMTSRTSDPNIGVERPKAPVRYKTRTQLIKERLDRIKAEMEKISEQHQRSRPKRKAYHPFVWNSLRPYTNTFEIDYLISVSSGQRGKYRGTVSNSTDTKSSN